LCLQAFLPEGIGNLDLGRTQARISLGLARCLAILVLVLHALRLVAQDAAVLGAMKEQAFAHSQAAEDVFYLADVFGPRFMDSPGYVQAGEWAVGRLQGYGLANVAKEYFVAS
jgi:carboxypeptidase Q